VMSGHKSGTRPKCFTTAVTCVIKTNPCEHFSVMNLIPTIISLDAYESLTLLVAGPGVLTGTSPAGHVRKRIDYD